MSSAGPASETSANRATSATGAAPRREPLSRDARKVLLAQALRALVYGFGSVHLGIVLESRGWSTARIGVLLTGVVAGLAIMTILVGRYGDRIGRRRCYTALFVALAAVGVALASTGQISLLLPVVLTGALSTEVVESGPFTSLEQSMLASEFQHHRLAAGFSIYNATATMAGSVGALLAGGPKLLQSLLPGPPSDPRLFLVFVPVALLGALVARSLSTHVEAEHGLATAPRSSLQRSRATVTRLSFLFAIDAFAGGFVIQTLIVVFLSRRVRRLQRAARAALLRHRPDPDRVVPHRPVHRPTHRAAGDDGGHPHPVQPVPDRAPLRVQHHRGRRPAAREGDARTDGRADPSGLRDGAGGPGRADGRGGVHGTARYIARPLAPLLNAPIQAIAPGRRVRGGRDPEVRVRPGAVAVVPPRAPAGGGAAPGQAPLTGPPRHVDSGGAARHTGGRCPPDVP